ncbi:MAG: hypothetical protein KDD69_16985 [Bdellovibrionales bacterium]|nr:hypothetical protein [Bdellovibrionales bacterium]
MKRSSLAVGMGIGVWCLLAPVESHAQSGSKFSQIEFDRPTSEVKTGQKLSVTKKPVAKETSVPEPTIRLLNTEDLLGEAAQAETAKKNPASAPTVEAERKGKDQLSFE